MREYAYQSTRVVAIFEETVYEYKYSTVLRPTAFFFILPHNRTTSPTCSTVAGTIHSFSHSFRASLCFSVQLLAYCFV